MSEIILFLKPDSAGSWSWYWQAPNGHFNHRGGHSASWNLNFLHSRFLVEVIFSFYFSESWVCTCNGVSQTPAVGNLASRRVNVRGKFPDENWIGLANGRLSPEFFFLSLGEENFEMYAQFMPNSLTPGYEVVHLVVEIRSTKFCRTPCQKCIMNASDQYSVFLEKIFHPEKLCCFCRAASTFFTEILRDV